MLSDIIRHRRHSSPRHPFTLDHNRLIRTVPPISNNHILRNPVPMRINNSNRLVRREIKMSLPTLLHLDEGIVEPGQNKADRHKQHGHISDNEPDDLARVVAQGVEGRVREAEDDGQDGHRDVAEQRAPEDRDFPVVAGRDDEV
jgi:hypothetical protein